MRKDTTPLRRGSRDMAEYAAMVERILDYTGPLTAKDLDDIEDVANVPAKNWTLSQRENVERVWAIVNK